MRSEVFYIIIGMALVTYFTRIGALALFRFTGVPTLLNRWLKYVPVAILTANLVDVENKRQQFQVEKQKTPSPCNYGLGVFIQP